VSEAELTSAHNRLATVASFYYGAIYRFVLDWITAETRLQTIILLLEQYAAFSAISREPNPILLEALFTFYAGSQKHHVVSDDVDQSAKFLRRTFHQHSATVGRGSEEQPTHDNNEICEYDSNCFLSNAAPHPSTTTRLSNASEVDCIVWRY